MNPAPFYTTPNVTHLCDHWASKERFSKFVTHISKFNKFVTYISYVGGWGGSIFFYSREACLTTILEPEG